jgi:CelD/BcsL family acetyltransferase involved in cellulose biosynthesis
MNVSVHEGIDSLPARVLAWAEAAGSRDFLSGLTWLRAFFALELEADARPRLYCAEVGGEPVALLPMQTPAARAGSAFRHRRRFGPTLSAATSFQTCTFSPILCADTARAAEGLRACLDHIARRERHWSWIDFNALDPDAPWFGALIAAARAAGYAVRAYPHFPNRFERYAHTDLASCLAERAPEDRKQFQNYERKWRKLQRESGAVFRFVGSPADDIDRAVGAYEAVHARSWKAPDRSPEFVPRILREAFAAGVLRMGILEAEGRPVAVEVGIARPGGVTMLKTAYDEALRERSVGAVVILRTIEQLIAGGGIREIDFGRDDEPYKRLWMPQCRFRQGVAAFDPRQPGGLYGLLAEASDTALRWTKTRVRPILRGIGKK